MMVKVYDFCTADTTKTRLTLKHFPFIKNHGEQSVAILYSLLLPEDNLVSVSCLKSCHYCPANLLRRLLW